MPQPPKMENSDGPVKLAMEGRLFENKQLLGKILDEAPTMIWVADPYMNFIYLNQSWLNFTQLPFEALNGRNWLNYVHPEDYKHVIDSLFAAQSIPDYFKVEFRLRHHTGKYRWVMLNGGPIDTEDEMEFGFIGSGSDVHERKVMDQNKNEFLNFASHELKTPLTALNTYLQIIELKTQSGSFGDIFPLLQKARTNTDMLVNLISNFLDITRIEVGKIALEMEEAPLDQVVREVVEQSGYIYSSHQIIIKQIEPVRIVADAKRMRQVLDNLISNAVRHSDSHPAIEVNLYTREDKLYLTVVDQGRGIPAGEHEKIFEKYYQLEKDPHKVVGIGMGLYIVKTIIEEHGGKIWVESEMWKGATFTIELPK